MAEVENLRFSSFFIGFVFFLSFSTLAVPMYGSRDGKRKMPLKIQRVGLIASQIAPLGSPRRLICESTECAPSFLS
jgi:hypothetical protein